MKTMRTRVRPVHSWAPNAGVARPAVFARFHAWPLDLVLLVLLTFLATGMVWLEAPTALRVGFGLPLIVFFPGYALTSALFPRQDGPDGVERIALGFGLSLATLPLLALTIDYSPWSVTTGPLVVSLTAVTVAATVLAAERRRRMSAGERYQISLELPAIHHPRRWDRSMRITVGLIALALLLLGIGGIPVVVNRLAGDALTEFALYNPSGDPQFYPREITVGEPAEVQLSVANHEGKTMTYTLAIAGAGIAVDPLSRITLTDGETWNGSVRFTVASNGESLPVSFELRRTDRSDAAEPYRTLQLVVDGRTPAASTSG